jgi:hypothetical protein
MAAITKDCDAAPLPQRQLVAVPRRVSMLGRGVATPLSLSHASTAMGTVTIDTVPAAGVQVACLLHHNGYRPIFIRYAVTDANGEFTMPGLSDALTYTFLAIPKIVNTNQPNAAVFADVIFV